MEANILNKIGLTESERKVYLALIELGDSTRSDIVNKSGVAGSKVYDLIDKLMQKGLISVYIHNKIKHFKPTNPHQIINYIDEKKQEILNIEKEAKLLLPSLMLKFNSSKEEQEVELINGLKGLEIIFREQVALLKKGEACYVIGGTKGTDEEIIQVFFEKIHLLREEKGIRTLMIYNLAQKNSVNKLYSSKKYPHTRTRFIDHTSPVAINIYKDRTVIIIFGNKISAIHIKSQDIANSFVGYFNLLWKISRG